MKKELLFIAFYLICIYLIISFVSWDLSVITDLSKAYPTERFRGLILAVLGYSIARIIKQTYEDEK